MGLEGGRVSNAMGVPLNQWIMNQLNERSKQTKATPRDTDNLIYQANKTAWIRMVSSVDIANSEDLDYFNSKGLSIKESSDLAKKFVLQGGVSIYNSDNNSFSYKQRAGLSGAYNVAGNNEVSEYGYRPMPGIMSVKVNTQGKMGSIRSADIQIKVWDKDQLDIIDALFFKLGYTMFLEWGHTNYYDSDTGTLKQTEEFSVNPFTQGLTKEKIFNSISRNVIKSQGNYDAMLGMVTNFNFTYNQEGGYDCTIKLMSLGILASGIKINNPRVLPNLEKDVIKQLVDTLVKIEKERIQREWEKENPVITAAITTTTTTVKPKTLNEFFEDRIKTTGKGALRDYLYLPTQAGKGAQISDITKSDIVFEPEELWGIRKFGAVLKSELAEQQISSVTLDGNSFRENLPYTYFDSGLFGSTKYTIANEDDFAKLPAAAEDRVPDTTGVVEWAARALRGGNFDIFQLDYSRQDQQEVIRDGKLQKIKDVKRNYTVYVYIGRSALRGTKGITGGWDVEPTEFEKAEVKKAVYRQLFTQDAQLGQARLGFETVNLATGNTKYTNKVNVPTQLKYVPNLYLYNSIKVDIAVDPKNNTSGATVKPIAIDYVVQISDSGLIKDLKIKSGLTIDTLEQAIFDAAKNPIVQIPPPPQPPEPSLNVSDIQKSESLKYQSAFEVIIRTIQLYSLNNAINTGIESEEPKVSKLILTNPPHYEKFTKGLFTNGLFSNYLDSLLITTVAEIQKECEQYDSTIDSGTMTESDMMKLRSRFGFNFSLLSNKVSAKQLLDKKTIVDYPDLMTTYTIPYRFNAGVFEGTQVNHPVYIKLGFVLMIINHICNIYDVKKDDKSDTPMIYFDFNPSTNTCLSNAKQLSTNPYDVLIPFEGFDSDFRKIIDPLVVVEEKYIRPVSGSDKKTEIFKPQDKELGDRLSADLPKFKIIDSTDKTEAYRGKTMNVLVSTDYLLKTVANYAKQDQSNDIYAKEFIEQILFDINKYLGDFNMFRLAYDDSGNTMHITDDQMSPNLENSYISQTNKTEFPLFGLGSLARSLEIRTEISSKLSNMLAISANSSKEGLSSLSKTSDSFGFYNLGYNDRYIPARGELTVSASKVTDAMINSAIQFNKAIETYYSDTTPAESSVSHATNYFIERMSKIKGEESGSRASAVIPVSLNFSTDGISGLGMGQAFTVSPQFLPYTYDLSLRDPYGEKDKVHTVGFVIVGLDQTIEGNQWLSNVRANMMYLKQRQDFEQASVRTLEAPAKGFKTTQTFSTGIDEYPSTDNFTNYPTQKKNYSNILFGKGPLGDPGSEPINPILLDEINIAASKANTIVTITTGIGGHKLKSASGNISRHSQANAVDIAIVDNVRVNPNESNRKKVDDFVLALVNSGYVKNAESGNKKAVLTFGFSGHDNHIHVSYDPTKV